MDLLLPPWLKCARVGFRYIDATGLSQGMFGGPPKTAARGGDRLSASLEFTPQATSTTETALERAALLSFLSGLKGKQNRAYLTNPARRLRGSFPAAELISNNTFASGTTGWTVGSHYTLSVHDRVARMVRVSVSGQADALRSNVAASVTQYAPHVFRLFRRDIKINGSTYLVRIGSTVGGNEYFTSAAALAAGMASEVFVPMGTSAFVDLRDSAQTAVMPHENIIDVPYTSMSRCLLADGGGNLLLQSDDFTTTWANTRSTDAANATAAPDGTTTADSIIEDATASNTHYIEQTGITISSAIAEYAVMFPLKAGTRSWARIALIETTGSSSINAYFDLTNGAVGTPATGTNWANLRTFVVSLGNGYFGCCLVGTKTNAATSLTLRLLLATGNGVDSYTGDGTSLIYAWRPTLRQSSFPARLTATTAAAVATAAQTGSAVHVKGLPVSSNGLLLPGDEIEVITSLGSELKTVTAPLNSDAAGLGHLQFSPPLRGTLADNAAIIVHEPMGRFLFTGEAVGWDHSPGIVTQASAEFLEAA